MDDHSLATTSPHPPSWSARISLWRWPVTSPAAWSLPPPPPHTHARPRTQLVSSGLCTGWTEVTEPGLGLRGYVCLIRDSWLRTQSTCSWPGRITTGKLAQDMRGGAIALLRLSFTGQQAQDYEHGGGAVAVSRDGPSTKQNHRPSSHPQSAAFPSLAP